ncbi:hypothetical protein D3Z53_19685 [Lachnospiraceae bacterium]|jgi:hypothetical protein|nr:hypothetical protein [uncultured Schaedlerella sp.]NBI60212.1 hypothetical protein [Lachnospiraceae bacterium]
MYISGRNNIYRNPVNEKFFDIKKLEKAEKEEKGSRTETAEKTYPDLREDDLEISPEGRLAAVLEQEAREQAGSGIEAREKQSASKEQEETEIAEKQDDPEVSEEQGGKVAVNVGKRMRQIAAAKSRGQLQQVLSLLQKDLSDCKAGLEKGWCDESEIAKVEALISKAEARMSQVPQESGQEKEQGGLDEFAMASLM